MVEPFYWSRSKNYVSSLVFWMQKSSSSIQATIQGVCIKQWHRGEDKDWIRSTLMFHHETWVMSWPQKKMPPNMQKQYLNSLGRIHFMFYSLRPTPTFLFLWNSLPWVEVCNRNSYYGKESTVLLCVCFFLRYTTYLVITVIFYKGEKRVQEPNPGQMVPKW